MFLLVGVCENLQSFLIVSMEYIVIFVQVFGAWQLGSFASRNCVGLKWELGENPRLSP